MVQTWTASPPGGRRRRTVVDQGHPRMAGRDLQGNVAHRGRGLSRPDRLVERATAAVPADVGISGAKAEKASVAAIEE